MKLPETPAAPEIEPAHADEGLERHFTVQELGKDLNLHPSKVQEIFFDVPGVIRIGHPAKRGKRRYFTLRIPASVAKRVFADMTVPKAGKARARA